MKIPIHVKREERLIPMRNPRDLDRLRTHLCTKALGGDEEAADALIALLCAPSDEHAWKLYDHYIGNVETARLTVGPLMPGIAGPLMPE